jgi:hypothetical protein
MSYYSNIVQKVKAAVAKNSYPPIFESKIINLSIRNCYAYALNLEVSDPNKRVFLPGCISSESENVNIFDGSKLMDRLKRDLEFLGFTFRPNDEHLNDGEYRIAIYGLPTFHDMPIGFHISRQDKDGYWSEKRNWKAKPQKLDYCGIEAPKLDGVVPFKTEVLIIKRIQT